MGFLGEEKKTSSSEKQKKSAKKGGGVIVGFCSKENWRFSGPLKNARSWHGEK